MAEILCGSLEDCCMWFCRKMLRCSSVEECSDVLYTFTEECSDVVLLKMAEILCDSMENC